MNTPSELPIEVGRIIGNLQSMEFLLRLFLYDSIGPQHNELRLDRLKLGDVVPLNPLTGYDSLGTLIRKVNDCLRLRGVPNRVDHTLVEVRNALAHGRVSALCPEGPYHLLKFSKPSAGSVTVTDSVHLTHEWLSDQIRRTYDEVQKIMRLGQGQGLPGFPKQ